MQHELNIVGLFPIPIASVNIDLPDTRFIDWKYENDFKQSQYDLHTIPEWQDTCKTILKHAKNFLVDVGYEEKELFITQMWANEYPVGKGIPPHIHTNSLLSGCIYFDDNSPTIFHNQKQKQLEMVSIPTTTVTPYTSEIFTVEAKRGRMVLFPSSLAHSSEAAKVTRTTVSFNLLARELGTPDGFNYVNLQNC